MVGADIDRRPGRGCGRERMEQGHRRYGGGSHFCPADLGEGQLDQPPIISEGLTDVQFFGKLWRAREAITQGPMYHA